VGRARASRAGASPRARARARARGKGKGSGAGTGSTYADPGRPKSFQPTERDRQSTGNIAEYFWRAEKTAEKRILDEGLRGGGPSRSPFCRTPKARSPVRGSAR